MKEIGTCSRQLMVLSLQTAAAGGQVADGTRRAAWTQLKHSDRCTEREKEEERGESVGGVTSSQGCESLLKGAEIWRAKLRCCCETSSRGDRPDWRLPCSRCRAQQPFLWKKYLVACRWYRSFLIGYLLLHASQIFKFGSCLSLVFISRMCQN